MKHQTLVPPIHRMRTQRGAFTLVEVLVSLGVLMILMAVILVPINLGMNLFHIGKARSEVQQANQLVINQLSAELKKAVFVFPNEALVGITDQLPYSNDPDMPKGPYYDPESNERVSNTARLDFLLPALDNAGAFLMPPVANNYIVTYYARRLKVEDEGVNVPYDEFSNPMVLWRAQYPYKNDDGTVPVPLPTGFSHIGPQRYDDFTNSANTWLTQKAGEANLELLLDPPNALSSSHTQLTPRDMMLIVDEEKASKPDGDPEKSLQPNSSFTVEDTTLNGKIDRVTISIMLAKYDAINATGKQSQGIRSTQTITLPNIR